LIAELSTDRKCDDRSNRCTFSLIYTHTTGERAMFSPLGRMSNVSKSDETGGFVVLDDGILFFLTSVDRIHPFARSQMRGFPLGWAKVSSVFAISATGVWDSRTNSFLTHECHCQRMQKGSSPYEMDRNQLDQSKIFVSPTSFSNFSTIEKDPPGTREKGKYLSDMISTWEKNNSDLPKAAMPKRKLASFIKTPFNI
jgi:hypothetical protein